MDSRSIKTLLARGVETIYPSQDKFEEVLKSEKKLRIYLGIDPTSTKLHLGSAVPLKKLADFQKHGHKIILLLGDFTAMIGDPSDKEAARKMLSKSEVLENAQNYKKQASKILRFSGKNPAEIKFNSHWLVKLSFEDVAKLASNLTVGQMIERDLFQMRLKKKKPIYLHEFLYPLMQGYDSVAMDIDLEIGARDQTFNMLVGRQLVKTLQKREKYVLTTPLLLGTNGKKMAKTEGNIISLDDPANQMYGKLMSITDDLIIQYLTLCSNLSDEEIEKIKTELALGAMNPMIAKKILAKNVVGFYYSKEDGLKEEKEFERVFQKKHLPQKSTTIRVKKENYDICELLLETKLASSNSQAKRMIEQGAVEIEGRKIKDTSEKIEIGQGRIIKYGKKTFVKVIT